jgi:hypothetical protein
MRAAAATLLLTCACANDIAWKTVVELPREGALTAAAPTRFAFRNSGELWGYGGSVARRTWTGWDLLDMCGARKAWTTVGFSADGSVWALCGGGVTEGQSLLRYDALGKSSAFALPNDGSLALVQLADDIALLGASKLFFRDGEGWKEGAAHAFATPMGAGLSASQVYVLSSGAGITTLTLWNGSSWSAVGEVPQAADLELRDGVVYAGFFRVEGTSLVNLGDVPGAVGRPLTLFARVPRDAVLFMARPAVSVEVGSESGWLWLGRRGADRIEFVGGAPFHSGTLYGGGGIQASYAIDDGTYLVTIGNALVEGRR